MLFCLNKNIKKILRMIFCFPDFNFTFVVHKKDNSV